MASRCPQSECGFSLYRGVLVQWGKDQNEGILTFIAEMPEAVRDQLLIAQEHKASLALIWKGKVPAGYESGTGWDVEGDYWEILDSIAN